MALERNQENEPNLRELVITRVFDAPREKVFDAWTDPEQARHWWGPRAYTAPSAEADLRVGGKYLYLMRSSEGTDIWSTGEYREIVRPERVVCTDSFADEKGNKVPASYYGMTADFPLEMLITAIFEENDGKTKLTLHHEGIVAGEDYDGAMQGWNESLDKLAEYLAHS